MKCRECDCCKLGWFSYSPTDYVCIGVKHPFIIEDVNCHCTEYPERAALIKDDLVEVTITKAEYEDLLEYKRMYEDLCK